MPLIIKSLYTFERRRIWNNKNMETSFILKHSVDSQRNFLKILIELLPQMKDFLELIGSERPNLSDPPSASEVCKSL